MSTPNPTGLHHPASRQRGASIGLTGRRTETPVSPPIAPSMSESIKPEEDFMPGTDPSIITRDEHPKTRQECAQEAEARYSEKILTNYVFDIETGPLPDEDLKKLLPEFDPDEVKLGNLKDMEKIKAKIAEAQGLHFENFKDKAALSAACGRVLVAGAYNPETEEFIILEGEEKEILEQYWNEFNGPTRWIGHNVKGFDFPFLRNRSFILGVKPGLVMQPHINRCYWTHRIIDTMEEWKCFNSRAEDGTSNLDIVSKAFGFPGKNGNGKDFHKLYAKDRKKGIEYLKNDLLRTAEIAKAMGLV